MSNSNKQLQIDYLLTFTTDNGKRVLDDLRKHLVQKPVHGALGDGISQSLYMAKRAAEIELFNRIEKMIEKGSEDDGRSIG